MITVKTEDGEFKYKDWQWNLAWLIVSVVGFVVGLVVGIFLAH